MSKNMLSPPLWHKQYDIWDLHRFCMMQVGDRYILVKLLGHGSFSTVCLATDAFTEEKVPPRHGNADHYTLFSTESAKLFPSASKYYCQQPQKSHALLRKETKW